MSTDVKLVGYHTTSKDNASLILRDGFKIPKKSRDYDSSDETNEKFLKYWLGTGVYFFEDIEPAIWWKGKPTSFGTKGEQVVLESQITLTDDSMDLRKAKNWKLLIKEFDNFMKKIGDRIKVESESPDEISDLKKRLRCVFFDYFQRSFQIDVIVAAFNEKEFKYLDAGTYSIEENLDLFYTEVQYCVYNTDTITNMKLFKEG